MNLEEMRGRSDKDRDAIERWDKSQAASKERRGKGKIKSLVNKYLKKSLSIKDIKRMIDMAATIPELEKLGDEASGMKFSSSELKKLQQAVERKRKELGN